MGLKQRLDRLEKRTPPSAGAGPPLPPDFFLVMANLSLLEGAHTETRRMIEPMVRPLSTIPLVADRPDPIEEEIASFLAMSILRSRAEGDVPRSGLPPPEQG